MREDVEAGVPPLEPTRKAVNAPNDRQSRAVVGRAKLNAKATNTTTFSTTKSQSP
jgi:hypothetical protein